MLKSLRTLMRGKLTCTPLVDVRIVFVSKYNRLRDQQDLLLVTTRSNNVALGGFRLAVVSRVIVWSPSTLNK